jgi:hypothetical protein
VEDLRESVLSKFEVKPMVRRLQGRSASSTWLCLSHSRVVFGGQTSSGKLKVIVWDLALTNNNTVQTITRRGDTGEVEPVSDIAMSGTSESNQAAGAVRTQRGISRFSTGTPMTAG